MKLTLTAITRPLAVTMAILAIVLMGLIAHSRLGVDLLPNVAFPEVSVSISYPGASPSDIETLITKPVEDSVAGLANVSHVSSSSVEGQGAVTIQFADATNPDLAAIDVERAVNAIRAGLPADALAPIIRKFDVSAQPVLLVVLSGNRPQDQLFTLADRTLKTRLEGLDSVASVDVFGGLDREIQVQVDPGQLEAHHVALAQVVQALQQGNQNQPSGAVVAGSRRYDVRVVGEARTPSDLAQLLVAPASGTIVHISDVAKVVDTYKKQTFITRANGKPTVALAVYKQSTANTVAVSDSVHKLLPQLQTELPQGVTLSTIFDTSTSTRNSLSDVNQNLLAAVLITGVVLLFFLHNFRSMAIVLLAIPTSLISTYAVMYALGFTLNMLSLMALALLIGILVDDSIVVLENIHRHLQRGEPPRDAALNGRAEIGMAALAITLVDVVVYTPVAYMSGQIGAFFRQFGLTITAATIFSLLVSFTLTPMLASRWLRRDSGTGEGRWQRFGRSWDSGLDGVAQRYGGVVAWAISSLGRRLLVIGAALLLLAGSVALIPLHAVGSEFVPDFDQGLFTVSLEMPVGTPLDATTAMLDRLDGLASTLPEAQQTLALAGTGGGGGDQSRFGTIYVQLTPQATRHRSDKQLAAMVQAEAQRIPGITVRAVAPNFASGSGQPISYRIQGPDVAELGKLGDQVAALIAAVPGTANVKNSGTSNLPEVQVQVDQAHLGDLGLTTADVASLVHTALQGTVATQFRPPGRQQVNVRVLVAGANTNDPSTLLNLALLSPSGTAVPLAQVGSLLSTTGPSAINRYDRLRQVTVSADLTNRTLGDVSGDIRTGLARLSLPPGYKFVEAGSASDQNSAFTSLLQALALSVVLMYMLMVALYESFFTPFVIMFSLPTALVGALLALAVTRDTLNVLSMIGLIMLMGLVAKNAILLVDYTNTLRARGMPRAEAIRQAGQTRLRPILMTTTAMVLAMLPLALKIGTGAELRSAMGVVLIGGLLSSLLLTLVLVPVMYVTTENVTQRFGRGGRWLMRPFQRPKADSLQNGQAAEWPLPPVRQVEPVGGSHALADGD